MQAPRLPVTALYVSFDGSGNPVGVSRTPLRLIKEPNGKRTEVCSEAYFTNALSVPCVGNEKPNGGEIIELLQRIKARLQQQQLVATLDTEVEDLMRLEVDCTEMLKGLGHDPILQEALDARENLALTLEQYVGSTALDEIYAAVERLVQASIKSAVQGSSGRIMHSLAAAGVLQAAQPPGVDLASTIRKILLDKVQ